MIRRLAVALVAPTLAAAALAACAANDSGGAAPKQGVVGGLALHGGSGGGAGHVGIDLGLGAATDPTTCDQATSAHSYLGCDFWPTVTATSVWSVFDFAVVVANTGAEPADATVTLAGATIATVTVQPNAVQTIVLPWDSALKGGDADTCGASPSAKETSLLKTGAAYHLTSTKPVITYQFSPLEFRDSGGPDGKDWSSCPGYRSCTEDGVTYVNGCYSFTADASILLPTSAMTGNYRVATLPPGENPGFIAITATADGTDVKLKLAGKANVAAGPGVASTKAGGVLALTLNAGDVAQIEADGADDDLAGTLVEATHPVQVIGGSSCTALGSGVDPSTLSCDHVEESILPIETLGAHYVVVPPTGVYGYASPYMVRIHGNVDGTKLSYPSGGPPAGAPTTIDAGQTVDLGQITDAFEVQGDHEFLVSTFLVSAAVADPDDVVSRGDPSQSQAVTVEQFRKNYVFLAPSTYDLNFVDVTMPTGAAITLDGAPLPIGPDPIGSSSFGIARVRLGPGDGGAHVMSSDQPFGIQIIGYGSYTSYEYPGGLDLRPIAPPPPQIE